MKKILSFLLALCMLVATAIALVPYTSQPLFPYVVYGHVEWNDQQIANARVEVSNLNTGYSTVVTTNDEGYWQEDATNWLTTSKARPPVQFGDQVKIKTLDGCGTADTCEMTFSAFDSGYESSASTQLDVTGALLQPPASSGSSSGGSGGGGSPAVWDCLEWGACQPDGTQVRICTQGYYKVKRTETQSCNYVAPSKPQPEPETPQNPPQEPPIEQPPVVIPPVEPEPIPEDSMVFEALASLAGVILAALGVQWYRGIIAVARKQWRDGKKAQAMKTLFTLVKKAKEGAYDKK